MHTFGVELEVIEFVELLAYCNYVRDAEIFPKSVEGVFIRNPSDNMDKESVLSTKNIIIHGVTKDTVAINGVVTTEKDVDDIEYITRHDSRLMVWIKNYRNTHNIMPMDNELNQLSNLEIAKLTIKFMDWFVHPEKIPAGIERKQAVAYVRYLIGFMQYIRMSREEVAQLMEDMHDTEQLIMDNFVMMFDI